MAPPVEAKAALFFLEGHYQLNYLEGSVERTKFLSPAQIGKAFTVKDVFDSGWRETNVIRFAQEKKTHKILSVLPAGRRKIFITDPRSAEEREKNSAARRSKSRAYLSRKALTAQLPGRQRRAN